jgi:hypothetical protein
MIESYTVYMFGEYSTENVVVPVSPEKTAYTVTPVDTVTPAPVDTGTPTPVPLFNKGSCLLSNVVRLDDESDRTILFVSDVNKTNLLLESNLYSDEDHDSFMKISILTDINTYVDRVRNN